MENVQSYNLSNDAMLMLTSSGTYCYLVTAVYIDVYAIQIEGSVGKIFKTRMLLHSLVHFHTTLQILRVVQIMR